MPSAKKLFKRKINKPFVEDDKLLPDAYKAPVAERTFFNTASQFIPGYEQILDYKDVIDGVAGADLEKVNRGSIGMIAPFAGKAIMNTFDYLSDKSIGKEQTDINAKKRNDIINLGQGDKEQLFIKYGHGGYDKWAAEGYPDLYKENSKSLKSVNSINDINYKQGTKLEEFNNGGYMKNKSIKRKYPDGGKMGPMDEQGAPVSMGNKEMPPMDAMTTPPIDYTNILSNKEMELLNDASKEKDFVKYVKTLSKDSQDNLANRLEIYYKNKLGGDPNHLRYWEIDANNPVNLIRGLSKPTTQAPVTTNLDGMSFSQAFGEARKNGLSTFKWKGKSYGTKIKGETNQGAKLPPPVTSELEGAPQFANGGYVDPVRGFIPHGDLKIDQNGNGAYSGVPTTDLRPVNTITGQPMITDDEKGYGLMSDKMMDTKIPLQYHDTHVMPDLNGVRLDRTLSRKMASGGYTEPRQVIARRNKRGNVLPPESHIDAMSYAERVQASSQLNKEKEEYASGGNLNFKSAANYHKWLGYVHANKLAENTPGHQNVSIDGEPHRVQHDLGGNLGQEGIQVTDKLNRGDRTEAFKSKKAYEAVKPFLDVLSGIVGGGLNMVAPGAGTALNAVTSGIGSIADTKLTQATQTFADGGSYGNKVRDVNSASNRIKKIHYTNKFYEDLGSMTEAPRQGGYNYAVGGQLTQIDGPSHEEGGFSMGPNEVELKENIDPNNQYVYSDKLKMTRSVAKALGLPDSTIGKKIAKLTANVQKKYGLRDDKLTQEAMQQELDTYRQANEMLRQNIMDSAYKRAFGGRLYAGGGGYDPNNPVSSLYVGPQNNFQQDQPPYSLFTPPSTYVPQDQYTTPELLPEGQQVNNFMDPVNPVQGNKMQLAQLPNFTPSPTGQSVMGTMNPNIPDLKTVPPVSGSNSNQDEMADQGNKINPWGYVSSGVTTAMKGILNTIQDSPKSTPNVYLQRKSLDPVTRARILGQRNIAGMNRTLGASGTTSGQILANQNVYGANAAANLANVTGAQDSARQDENRNISNMEAINNQQTTAANNLQSEQYKDNKLNNWMTILDSGNMLGQTMVNDHEKNKIQNEMIKNWIATADYRVVDGKPTYIGKNDKGEMIYVDANTEKPFIPKTKINIFTRKKGK